MYILNKAKKWSRVFLSVALVLCLQCSFSVLAEDAERQAAIVSIEKNELLGGWYTLDPYQYQKDVTGIKVLTGLDVELMKAISKETDGKVKYEYALWEDLLNDIENGKKDFATGALFSEERAKSFYYSLPFRYEEDSLFVEKSKLKDLNEQSLKELLECCARKKFKLGVVKGFIYADPLINQYINDPQNQDNIVRVNNDYENLELLLNKEIDGFLADRIVGATIIWRMGVEKEVSEKRLHVIKPIHIIFSKKTVSPDVVQKYNSAIQNIKNTERYQKIVSWYLYPVLLLQIEDAGWFKFTEVIGIVAFAISGLIIAFKERATLFGALILAILPSLGGGLMRDVIFGRTPVGALQSPMYLLSVLLTVIVGFIVIKLLTFLRRQYEVPGEIEDFIRKQANHVLIITDAIGLAMFTVTGVIISLLMKADPLWLWGPFFAFLTGAGGGILRDMLSKTRYIAALEGELYGEIAIIWGLFLSMFVMISSKNIEPEYIQYAVVITILGVFFSRMVVHFMRIPNARFGRES
jgi:polar amino acid transport system substrate-binding protein